ncbi:MAG: plastocyanin/azurin family copper-binding protein [Steroidobacterales bacterium]|jgi:plastocyanin
MGKRLLLTAAGAAALCWAAAGPVAVAAGAAAAAPTIVVAKEFMFAPLSLNVTVGSTVTWTNQDDEPHTVVSDTGMFRSGAMDTHESFSFRFDKPGTYHYACSIHPRMVGTIIVQ